MSTPCIQKAAIATIWDKIDAHHQELFEGRGGRPSLNVRLDRVERVVNKLVYISTALLVSVLLGSGVLLVKALVAQM